MTFRVTPANVLDVVRNLVDDLDLLKRQTGTTKQNTIRLKDWVVEMENDTVIKTTNLVTGVVSYIGLPIDPSEFENIFDQKWSYSGTVKPTVDTPGQKWKSQFACRITSLCLTLQTASTSSYTIKTYVGGVLKETSILSASDTEQEYSMNILLYDGDILYPTIVANATGTGTQLGIIYRITQI